MNGFSNRDYYRDFELQRDAALRNAEHQHLAHLATEPDRTIAKPQATKHLLHLPHVRLPHVRLPHSRWHVRHALTFMLAIGLAAVSALPLLAQDLVDAGVSEPHDPALVSYRVGYYFQLQGDHERAVENFDEVIARFPNWDGGYAARGDSYAALGQFELAVADYSVALDLTPGFVSVLYMRGRAYQSTGEAVLAIADFQNAINQMPDYALPYRGLADVYYEQHDNALALDCYSQYLALVGETPDADVTTAMSLLTSMIAAETGS